MTCPRCHASFDPAQSGGDSCPQCGTRIFRNVSGVMKTSAVMISAGGEEGFYSSVQDVPEPLRRQLMESTGSENSGTIVIADRAGKEQLTQVLGRRESARRAAGGPGTGNTPQGEALAHLSLPDAEASSEDRESEAAERRTARLKWIAWGGFAVVLALAAAFALFFGMRW